MVRTGEGLPLPSNGVEGIGSSSILGSTGDVVASAVNATSLESALATRNGDDGAAGGVGSTGAAAMT
ncbi:MAG: hypothetical protein ABWY66_06310, partial [Xanthobacteraceae bacterium]